MKITDEMLKDVPRLYENGDKAAEEVQVKVKLFIPGFHWTWFVVEYDRAERLCFGFVNGDFPELGYFSLDELEEVETPYGTKIRLDLSFTGATLAEIKASPDKY